jgi:hypothetical protein
MPGIEHRSKGHSPLICVKAIEPPSPAFFMSCNVVLRMGGNSGYEINYVNARRDRIYVLVPMVEIFWKRICRWGGGGCRVW